MGKMIVALSDQDAVRDCERRDLQLFTRAADVVLKARKLEIAAPMSSIP